MKAAPFTCLVFATLLLHFFCGICQFCTSTEAYALSMSYLLKIRYAGYVHELNNVAAKTRARKWSVSDAGGKFFVSTRIWTVAEVAEVLIYCSC